MRLPHCVAIFYKILWFRSTNVIYEKLQRNAENACGNRMCKQALTYVLTSFWTMYVRSNSDHWIDFHRPFGRLIGEMKVW